MVFPVQGPPWASRDRGPHPQGRPLPQIQVVPPPRGQSRRGFWGSRQLCGQPRCTPHPTHPTEPPERLSSPPRGSLCEPGRRRWGKKRRADQTREGPGVTLSRTGVQGRGTGGRAPTGGEVWVVGPRRDSQGPCPGRGVSPDGQVWQPVQDRVEDDGQPLRVAELWPDVQQLVPGGPRRLT